jgi:regulator of cell morphogenesis and NO signaling
MFNDYKVKLVQHIRFEEQKLFPYVERLMEYDNANLTGTSLQELLYSFSARDFFQNHDPIEEDLSKVRTTILAYSLSGPLPLPFRIFLNQIERFELDMTKHALIEDEVLIPMVVEIEEHLHKKLASL